MDKRLTKEAQKSWLQERKPPSNEAVGKLAQKHFIQWPGDRHGCAGK